MPMYLGNIPLFSSGDAGGGVPPFRAEKWWLDESIPLEDRRKIFRKNLKGENFTTQDGALSQEYIIWYMNSGTLGKHKINNVSNIPGVHILSITPTNILG